MKVIVLFEGIHDHVGPKPGTKVVDQVIKIRSSSILLKGEKTILVDSSHFKFEKELLDALKQNGVEPEDVDYLINTHTHRDHISNNHLFKNAAPLIHHLGIWYPDGRIEAYEKSADMDIPGIKLMETPGHTADSISVIVESKGKTFVLCGDAVREDVIRRFTPVGYATRPEYKDSAKMIFKIADVIVPGHGQVIKEDKLEELKKIVDNWK